MNNHWRPDIVLLAPNNKFAVAYEIKSPNPSHKELRFGIIQTLEGFIYGFCSYYVIYDKDYDTIKHLLFDQIGIFTYNSEGGLSLIKDAETPTDSKDIVKDLLNKQIPKPRKVKIRNYNMIRNGKLIHVRGHLAKRKSKRR